MVGALNGAGIRGRHVQSGCARIGAADALRAAQHHVSAGGTDGRPAPAAGGAFQARCRRGHACHYAHAERLI
jgi:hypothetical protein